MSNKLVLDRYDRRILAHLKDNARIPIAHISRSIGLSRSAVNQRLSKLEDLRVIRGYHTIFGNTNVVRTIDAFITFKLGGLEFDTFKRKLLDISEVYAIYHVSGFFDVLLHVQVDEIEQINRVRDFLVKNLIHHENHIDIHAVISTTMVKHLAQHQDKNFDDLFLD